MIVLENKTQKYSLEEYRNLEEKAEFKHEYNDGEIVEMTGGTVNHNTIILNLIFMLKLALKDQNYHIYSSDLRLFIPQYNKGTYPDIMVVNGEPILNDNRQDEILNPCLIIEVLSPSTQNYDRGDKFLYYRSIPYLKEYLLVSQTEYYLEYYRKTGENQWLLQEYKGSETKLNLELINVSLSMQELYAQIKL